MQTEKLDSCYPTPFADSYAEDETREVYARFGLATYLGNVVDEALSNCLVVFEFAFRPGAGRAGVADFQAEVAKDTMGRKVTRLASSPRPPSDGLIALLKQVVAERNDLAHRFMAEKCTKWFSKVGRTEMIAQLKGAGDLFERVDKALECEYRPRAEALNMADKLIREIMDEQIANERARDAVPNDAMSS
jgi:hypothetical protein